MNMFKCSLPDTTHIKNCQTEAITEHVVLSAEKELSGKELSGKEISKIQSQTLEWEEKRSNMMPTLSESITALH